MVRLRAPTAPEKAWQMFRELEHAFHVLLPLQLTPKRAEVRKGNVPWYSIRTSLVQPSLYCCKAECPDRRQ
jgi:hypothetical protein